MKLFYVKHSKTLKILTTYEHGEQSEFELSHEGEPFFHELWYLQKLIRNELSSADMLMITFSSELKQAIENGDLEICEINL